MRMSLKRCCDEHAGVTEHVHLRPKASFMSFVVTFFVPELDPLW